MEQVVIGFVGPSMIYAGQFFLAVLHLKETKWRASSLGSVLFFWEFLCAFVRVSKQHFVFLCMHSHQVRLWSIYSIVQYLLSIEKMGSINFAKNEDKMNDFQLNRNECERLRSRLHCSLKSRNCMSLNGHLPFRRIPFGRIPISSNSHVAEI